MKVRYDSKRTIYVLSNLALMLVLACDFSMLPLLTTSTIGDYVWNDVDSDGIQAVGESGLENVVVNLFDSAGILVDTTLTDADGLYSFTDLGAEEYYVVFEAPAGFIISPQDQGSDDTVDSDADQATGQTDNFTLTTGENNTSVDTGLWTIGGPTPTPTLTTTPTLTPTPTITVTPHKFTPLPGTWLYQAEVGDASCVGGGVVASPQGFVSITVSPDGDTFWIAFPTTDLQFNRTSPGSFATTPITEIIDTHGGDPPSFSATLQWQLLVLSPEEMDGTLTVDTEEPCTITHFLHLEKQ